jgi:hypothetical protein
MTEMVSLGEIGVSRSFQEMLYTYSGEYRNTKSSGNHWKKKMQEQSLYSNCTEE